MEKLREMYEYYGVTDLSVEFDMHSEHGTRVALLIVE